MQLLKRYFALQKEIHDYFGYQENYRVIPLADMTANHWMIIAEGVGGRVVYSHQPFTPESIEEGKAIYSASIYTQRYLEKWVYRRDAYTLVCADTQTDGNKFLMIFDNARECTDKALKELYRECW